MGSSSSGRFVKFVVPAKYGSKRSTAWYVVHHWPAKSSKTLLWPSPTQRFPFMLSTGVPPTRPARSDAPVWSTNGPVGDSDRPTKTLYPVSGPAQQLVAETKR